MEGILRFDPHRVATPAFVVDLGLLEDNLQVLSRVQERAECTILLALKGFAMWGVANRIRAHLPGVAASSPHEARLGKEEFQGEVHSYAPAYAEADFPEMLSLSDHLVFNSPQQWERLKPIYERYLAEGGSEVALGLRINPEHSEVEKPIYDPCAPCSRLGTTATVLSGDLPEGISGLHFHTLCELGADALARTIDAIEARFAPQLERARWVNFGGGHHITRPGYDVDQLVELVRAFRERWDVDVILEPGEAIAIRTGVLVSSVLDVVHNEKQIAIVDTSVSAHMPDCLEVPYVPDVHGAAEPGVLPHEYRIGGLTCLAGDIMGDYSFATEPDVGSRVVFLDMAHYTMVKTTNFNGVRLPDIATYDPDADRIEVLHRFDYTSYRDRLS